MQQAARERGEMEAGDSRSLPPHVSSSSAGQHAAALSSSSDSRVPSRWSPPHWRTCESRCRMMKRRRLEAERRRAEEERRRRERQAQEEEERRRAAEAARQRLEEEARRLAIEAQEVERRRLEAEAELRRKEAEERRRKEEETRREREEAERQRATDEARRRREEEQRRVMSDATVHIDRFDAVTEMLPSPAVEPTIRLEQPRTPATVPATVSSPSSRRVTWTVAAIVAILVLTIAGVLVRRASAPGAAETVVFQIIPWAKIDAITPKAGGQSIGGANLVTPCLVALPPGEYHVRATNPNFPPLEFDLTVKSGGPQAVRASLDAGFQSRTRGHRHCWQGHDEKGGAGHVDCATHAYRAGSAGCGGRPGRQRRGPDQRRNLSAVPVEFRSPGASANAMGQAFIGVADDATAATTNPAGLVNLTRPQVYLEYKNTDLRVQRLANADSFFTGQPTTFATNVNSPSFLNVAWPVGSKVAVAFTRHEFLNQQESFQLAPRAYPSQHAQWLDSPGGVSCDRQRQFQWRELCRFRGRSTQQARQRWPDCFVQSP